jgi:transcriptional regulator with XRE-family HTH domain
MTGTDALRRYREAADLSLEALAGQFGVNRSTVLRWERKVPADRIVDIERVTGIPRRHLRPDLYRRVSSD